MKKIDIILLGLILPLFLALTGCGDDEPDAPQGAGDSNAVTQTEIRPSVKIINVTGTKDDFTVGFRVRSVSKPDVTLYWSAEKKVTSTPKLNKSGSVTKTYEEVYLKTQHCTEYYYKVTHAGFMPGDRVYYKVVASNSKGTDETSVKYVTIKR